MMRIVLDTNVLLVSLPSRSKYHPVFEALVHFKYILLISNDIYLEYLEIIANKASPSVLNLFTEFVYKLPNIEVVDVSFRWNLIVADRDDNKFSDCAIAGRADFLVTNDRDFSVLKNLEFPPVHIITAEKFMDILQNPK